MKNNTIVTIANANYFWGVFILLASMRKSGMDEPAIVFQRGFSQKMIEIVSRFGDVRVVEGPPVKRNLTCLKPDALLLADTDYITWVDSDGYFSGNVSAELPPSAPGKIHVRLRSPEDNGKTFTELELYSADDRFGDIPASVLAVWRRDCDRSDDTVPKLKTCASACIFSLDRSSRPFLEDWQRRMVKYIPDEDVGVVNRRQTAYRQLDESVLNCMLSYWEGAPEPDGKYRLDGASKAMFMHVVGVPKPWQWWTRRSLRYYREIMDIMGWAAKNGFADVKFPPALKSIYAPLHRLTLLSYWPSLLRKLHIGG